MSNELNIAIFKDTLAQAREKYPIGEVRYYKDNRVLTKANFSKVGRAVDATAHGIDVPITMMQCGTVHAGYVYANEMRVAILNFADGLVPGGLVWEGAPTQEENICRCSNLYLALNTYESMENYYKPNSREILCTDNIIYARDITVFKEDKTYHGVEPRKLDVITCPAPNVYITNREKAMDVYSRRIRDILLSAIENGAECIVLGAWGCGAFNQPPELIARAFAEELNIYANAFKQIIFAIKPTPTGDARCSATFNIFKDVFNNYFKGHVIDEKYFR